MAQTGPCIRWSCLAKIGIASRAIWRSQLMQGTRQSPPEKGPLGSGHTPKPTPWWMARASPMFAGEPAPTVIALAFRCFAIQLPRQILHRPEVCAVPVGAGVPAKSPTRCMAPASPVFAAKAAPTVIALALRCYARQLLPQGPRADLWERLARTRYLPSTTGYAGHRRWPRHRTRIGCSSACRTGCWR